MSLKQRITECWKSVIHNGSSRVRRLKRQYSSDVLVNRKLLSALVSGLTQNSRIAVAKEIDTYTFQAAAGESMQFSFADTSNSNFTPRVKLYDPTGKLVKDFNSPTGGSLSFGNLVQGTYTISLSDSTGNYTGNYNYTFVKTRGPHTLNSTEGALTSGLTKSGSITAADIDVFTFQAVAGENMQFSFADTSNSNFTPRAKLYDPTGKLVKDFSSPTGGSLSLGILVQGTYTLTLSDSTGNYTGNYSYTFVKTRGPHTLNSTEGALTSGVTKHGSITAADIDVFTFQAAVGESMQFSFYDTTYNEFAPWVKIFDPTGKLLTQGSTGDGLSLSLTALKLAGTYTITLCDNSGVYAGTYDYTFVKTPGPQTLNSTEGALTSGVTKSGMIVSADIDVFTFQAAVGESMQFSFYDTTYNEFSPWVKIFDPTGKLLTQGSTGDGLSLSLTALKLAGTYTITLCDRSGVYAGTYDYTFVKTPGPQTLNSTEGALTSGVTKSGMIVAADIDVFTFQAAVGESMQFSFYDTTYNEFAPWVKIFDPTGKLLTQGSTGDGLSLSLTALKLAGTYTITLCDSTGVYAGTYDYTFVKTPGPQTLDSTEGALTSGETRNGMIVAADIDVFTFQAAVGESIQFSFADTSNNEFTPWVKIFDPTGKLLTQGSTGDSSSLSLTALKLAGTYTITLCDRSGVYAGLYNYTFVKTPIAHVFNTLKGTAASGVIESDLLEIV